MHRGKSSRTGERYIGTVSDIDSQEQRAGEEHEATADEEGSGVAEAPEVSAQDPDRAGHGGVREIARPSLSGKEKIRRYWPIGALAVSTVVLIVGITLALKNATGGEPEPRPARDQAAAGDVVTVDDKEAGFSLKYPKDWMRLTVPPGNPDLRLVLAVSGTGPGSDDGMWVRVVPPERVNQKVAEFENELKATTVLRQEQVTHNGMSGARVVYVTKDQASGQENVHLHYLLRRGQGPMYVLVFQAQPRSDLTPLAPAFDQVLSSFQTTEAPPPSPPTTAAR